MLVVLNTRKKNGISFSILNTRVKNRISYHCPRRTRAFEMCLGSKGNRCFARWHAFDCSFGSNGNRCAGLSRTAEACTGSDDNCRRSFGATMKGRAGTSVSSRADAPQNARCSGAVDQHNGTASQKCSIRSECGLGRRVHSRVDTCISPLHTSLYLLAAEVMAAGDLNTQSPLQLNVKIPVRLKVASCSDS